jgi:hypothetical protein
VNVILYWLCATSFAWGWLVAHKGLRWLGITRGFIKDFPFVLLLGYPLLIALSLIVLLRSEHPYAKAFIFINISFALLYSAIVIIGVSS